MWVFCLYEHLCIISVQLLRRTDKGIGPSGTGVTGVNYCVGTGSQTGSSEITAILPATGPPLQLHFYSFNVNHDFWYKCFRFMCYRSVCYWEVVGPLGRGKA